jgi:hypothetical protein
MGILNLNKLNKVDGKEKYPVEAADRFAAVEYLDTEMEIIVPGKQLRKNIKISAKENLCYYELKNHM